MRHVTHSSPIITYPNTICTLHAPYIISPHHPSPTVPPSNYHHHQGITTTNPSLPIHHHQSTTTNPPSPIHHHQSTITNPPSPIHHHQSTITNPPPTRSIPGVVISVVHEDECLQLQSFHHSIGFNNLQQRLPIDPIHTKFAIGSISKSFTSALMLLLLEQNQDKSVS